MNEERPPKSGSCGSALQISETTPGLQLVLNKFHRPSSFGCRWLIGSSPLVIGSLFVVVPRKADVVFPMSTGLCIAPNLSERVGAYGGIVSHGRSSSVIGIPAMRPLSRIWIM